MNKSSVFDIKKVSPKSKTKANVYPMEYHVVCSYGDWNVLLVSYLFQY